MSQFTQLEENIFALLENAENTQAYASNLLSKIDDMFEKLEQAEKKRNEQVEMLKQQAIKKEEERQLEWQAWQDAQAKQYEERKIELETQARLQQEAQTQKWEAWQQSQQQKLLASIDGFNAESKRIITSLDDKIKTVDLSQSAVERKISEGVHSGVYNLLSNEVTKSFGAKLAEMTGSLSSTHVYLKRIGDSVTQVYRVVKELESSTFDALGEKVEIQVAKAVDNGLATGLTEGSEKVKSTIESVEQVSRQSQNRLLSELEQGVKKVNDGCNVFENSIFNEYNHQQNRIEKEAKLSIHSLQKVKQSADQVVEGVEAYHDRLVNKQHWIWVLGWTAFITLFVTVAGIITYQVNKPDLEQRIQVASDVQMLLQQKKAIESSYAMQKTKNQNGKFYTWVDKEDCIDGDYCRQKEPTGYSIPTQQQLSRPITNNSYQQSQQSYQPPPAPPTNNQSFGNGNNPYSTNGNPFGGTSSNSNANPYKN